VRGVEMSDETGRRCGAVLPWDPSDPRPSCRRPPGHAGPHELDDGVEFDDDAVAAFEVEAAKRFLPDDWEGLLRRDVMSDETDAEIGEPAEGAATERFRAFVAEARRRARERGGPVPRQVPLEVARRRSPAKSTREERDD
jgi:hypothetical protein